MKQRLAEVNREQDDSKEGRKREVGTWKEYTMLGWHEYVSSIGFVTVPCDHVACLTELRVISAINAEITGDTNNQIPRFTTQQSNVEEIKQYAQSLFLSNNTQQLADAICWFELIFKLKPELESIYGFNGPFSRLTAINRLRLL